MVKSLARFRVTLLCLVLVPMLLALPGCDTFAVSRAETPEQKAAALLGDFNLYQRASLKIGEDQSVPTEVRRKVLEAEVAAKPVADKLDDALLQYRAIALDLKSGSTTSEKVAIAAANLQGWIKTLTPLIQSLRQQVEVAHP